VSSSLTALAAVVLASRAVAVAYFTILTVMHTIHQIGKKVQFSRIRYRALGPELSPVYRQSAGGFLSHQLVVGCHYFLPGLSPSQLKNITILQLVPSCTAC